MSELKLQIGSNGYYFINGNRVDKEEYLAVENNELLRQILEKVKVLVGRWGIEMNLDESPREILNDICWREMLTVEEFDQAIAKIKALYRKEIEEAIGEDEPLSNRCDNCGIKGCCGGDIPAVKNMFRAKLRAKLLPPTKGGNDV